MCTPVMRRVNGNCTRADANWSRVIFLNGGGMMLSRVSALGFRGHGNSLGSTAGGTVANDELVFAVLDTRNAAHSDPVGQRLRQDDAGRRLDGEARVVRRTSAAHGDIHRGVLHD